MRNQVNRAARAVHDDEAGAAMTEYAIVVAGIAGVVFSSRSNGAQPSAGNMFEPGTVVPPGKKIPARYTVTSR